MSRLKLRRSAPAQHIKDGDAEARTKGSLTACLDSASADGCRSRRFKKSLGALAKIVQQSCDARGLSTARGHAKSDANAALEVR